MMRLSPAAQFRCCNCERDFKNEGALTNHLRYSQVHTLWKDSEINNVQNQQDEDDRQTKCKKCPRTFKNWAALKQHLMSIHHKPLSNIKYMADMEPKKHSTSTEFLDSYPSSTILTPTLSAITRFYSILTLLWPRNSHGYQTCPLCPLSSTRKFKHDALQQHISSSVHN
ncbi:hypothetical protein H4I96_12089 [Botrytis cinerea]